MQKYKVSVLNDPFPHIIVENTYNAEEQKLVWQEIEFLSSLNKFYDNGKFIHAPIKEMLLKRKEKS